MCDQMKATTKKGLGLHLYICLFLSVGHSCLSFKAIQIYVTVIRATVCEHLILPYTRLRGISGLWMAKAHHRAMFKFYLNFYLKLTVNLITQVRHCYDFVLACSSTQMPLA